MELEIRIISTALNSISAQMTVQFPIKVTYYWNNFYM